MRRALLVVVALAVIALLVSVLSSADVAPRAVSESPAAGPAEPEPPASREAPRSRNRASRRGTVTAAARRIDGADNEGLNGAPEDLRGRACQRVSRERADGGSEGNDEALAGVRVDLFRGLPTLPDDVYATSRPVPSESQTTGGDGVFSFAIEDGESWRLVLVAPDGQLDGAQGQGPDDLGDLTFDTRSPRTTIRVLDDHDETPIEGAWAFEYTGSGDRRPVRRIDATGGVLEFSYRPRVLLVTAPGHAYAELHDPSVSDEVLLPRGFDIGGRVVDEKGAPYENLRVLLLDDGANRASPTDTNGRFGFERAAGWEFVSIRMTVGGQQVTRQIAMGDLDATVVISRGGDVSGVVVFADGRPAPDALVDGQPVDAEARFVLWGDGTATSRRVDARILRRFEGFGASLPVYLGAVRVEVRPGGVHDVRVVLEKAPVSFFSLAVTGPDRQVLPGSVWLTGSRWLNVEIHGDATICAVGLPPGSHLRPTVGAAHSELISRSVAVTTSATPRSAFVDVQLRRREPFTVRLIGPGGRDIPRGSWTAFSVQGYAARTTPEGRIDAPLGAQVRVVIVTPQLRFDERIAMPTSAPFEVVVRVTKPHTVSGRLLRGDGTPASAVSTVVVPMGRQVSVYPRDETGVDGGFSIRGVPAGRALIVGWKNPDDEMAFLRTIDVPVVGDVDLGEIVVWEQVRVTGRVTVPDGESAAGLRVEIRYANGRENETTLTDREGQFAMSLPGAADAVVMAYRRGRLFGVSAVDLSEERSVALRAVRVGTVRVRGRSEWRRTGMDVYVESVDGRVHWVPESDSTSDPDSVLLRDVPAGACRLRVEAGSDVVMRNVNVVPGAETQVDVRD